MNKRGQVAIFIIIGIVVLIIIGLIFYFKTDYIQSFWRESFGKVPEEIEPVNMFVYGCLEETSYDALDFVKYDAGHYDLPLLVNEHDTPYLFYEGVSRVPVNAFFEQELEKYINDFIYLCILDFEEFPDFDVSYQDAVSDVKIFDEFIFVNMRFPLKISKENETYSLVKFDKKIPVRYGMILDSVRDVVDEQTEFPSAMCVSCLDEVVKSYGLSSEFYNFAAGEVEYIMVDDESIVKEDSYAFAFALRFKE